MENSLPASRRISEMGCAVMTNALEILEEVNSGLYGRVFRARQTHLDREVALKIIKPEWPHAADAIEHAKALARLSHPNIVSVYGVETIAIEGIGDNVPAIVMEWLNGQTLGARLGGARFSVAQCEMIGIGLLNGLSHMHERGVAHGDLHYGNIIILNDYTPKIIDIDANKDVSLARLSTISRTAAVAGDIDYCRRVILAVFQRSEFPIGLINRLEIELQHTETISAIRSVVNHCLNDAVRPSIQFPSAKNVRPATNFDQARKRDALRVNADRYSADQLVTLAIGGHMKLGDREKERISPDQLAQLAIGQYVELNQHDKDRLTPDQLVVLAIGRQIGLSESDITRLKPHQLTLLKISGYV